MEKIGEIIKVGMADLKTCVSPDGLTTLGLGSCIGIAIVDPATKIGGLAHIMLPDSTAIKENSNIAKFADSGIKELVRQMAELGASQRRMVAKIAGGAQMFAFNNNSELLCVGERNAEASRKKLEQLGIPLLASDTGENYGRTIIFYPESGELVVKSVGRDVKTI